jgi:hypothetical protein
MGLIYDNKSCKTIKAKERHQIVPKVFIKNSVRKLFIEEKKGMETISSSRTVCLLDTTSSIFYLLHKHQNTIDTRFEHGTKILNDDNTNLDSFQIQFFV